MMDLVFDKRTSISVILGVIFMLTTSFSGLSQDDLTSEKPDLPSPESWVKEMETDFAKGLAKNAKWMRKDFTPQFLSNSLSSAIQDTVISTVLQLQKVHIKNSSGVLGYLKGVLAQIELGINQNNWSNWHLQVHSMIENRKWRKRLVPYLQNSASLFSEGIIANKVSAVWQFKGGEMQLGLDSLPFVKFSNGTLVCYAKGDSARVRETSGIFFPTLQRWKGGAGKVYWENTTFNDSLQFAVINSYEIKLTGSSFKTSPVTFHTELINRELEGVLTVKVKNSKTPHDRSYPKFESRNERLELKNIFPNMDFEGGIVVRGSKLDGISVGDTPGYLKIFNDDTLFIRCAVDEILFKADGFAASGVGMSIYLDSDSIYHPSIGVRYDKRSQMIKFIRDEDGIGMQAFSDSYHKIDFEVEVLTWEVGGRVLDLGALLPSGRGVGYFRSQANFDEASFDKMSAYAQIHPLIELGRFIHGRSGTGFYTSEYADYLKLSEEQARLLIINLALQGYVKYDISDRWCEWLPKAENHLLCNRGRVDYDVIAFRSEVSRGYNARLGLSNKILEIYGIPAFKLSRAQDVVVTPKHGRIDMSNDRDFKFSGHVKAGNFEFSGKGFEFDYSEFLIALNSVDNMHIRAEIDGEKGIDGKPKTRLVRNSIDGITGTLELDDPSNRSGWKSKFFTHYPVLNSEGPSYVYYDSQRIHKGAYHRNRFRYALEPFEIDSLDNFVKDDMRFKGELLAGGIVPDLQVDLQLMDDFSLGLKTSTPSEGFPLYNGIGKLDADLTLDMDGLQGTGSIDFLTSHIVGEDMVLVPDSTFGETTSYTNVVSLNRTPSIEGAKTKFTLNISSELGEPLLDVRSSLDKLRCFNDNVLLSGAIHLSESGMTANGEFEFEEAYLSSSLFQMAERGMKADTASFEIIGNDLNSLAFKTNNVIAEVDFDKRVGDFISHEGLTEIALPAVRYICTMDRFRWFMDEDQIELENTFTDKQELVFADLADKSFSNFVSVHPDQDSLHFACTRALYKVEEAIVECKDVRAMAIADAEVWPDSGRVTIRRDAAMDVLKRAQIYANDVTRYHRFFDATIQVNSRIDYTASATYLYKDAKGIDWPIYFSKIEVDTSLSTIANGLVNLGQEFYLSPYFEFTGEVNLLASRKNLEFDGGTRLAYSCDKYPRQWIQFSSVIDPIEVAIPLDSIVKELTKAHLGVGVLLSDDAPFTAYSAFFTKKPDRGDMEIFKPEGAIRYDKKKERYVVSNLDKLRRESLPGTLTELPENGCGIYSSGSTTLPFDFSIIDHTFVGSAWQTESGKIQMRGSLALDIYMAKELEIHLAEQLTNAAVSTPLDFSSTNYEYALSELVGLESADNALRELSRDGTFKKVPKDIKYTMMLTGLEFTYDSFEDAFISTAEIGIATIGDDAVFRTIPGRVEMVRDRGRDELRIYFHLSEGHWYYFEYNTFLNFETNDLVFMEIWNNLKEKDKTLTNPKTNKSIKMQVSRRGLRDDFVDRFRDFE
ncbi:MAG: hypothetical protein COA49_04920 [Bacteroidetes bacterium]|nr:MAG: hypothetical protein COA49_04920 [Bacteroidota bacterium]